MLRSKGFINVYFFTSLLLLGGCASKEKYQAALTNAQSVADNSRVMASTLDIAWNSVLDLATQQGYTVTQKDTKGKILSMTRTTPRQDDQDITDTVKASVTFVAVAEHQTRVFLAATQTTEDGKEVIGRDTVRNPEYYKDFFAQLSVKVTQKNKEAAVALAAAAAKAKAEAAAKEAADEKAADAEVAVKAVQVVAKVAARKAAEEEERREAALRAQEAAERAREAYAKRHKAHSKSHKK